MSQYEHEPDDQQPETSVPRLAVWTPIILTAMAVGGLVWWVQSDSGATIDRLRAQNDQDGAAAEIELPFEVDGPAAADGGAELVVAEVTTAEAPAGGEAAGELAEDLAEADQAAPVAPPVTAPPEPVRAEPLEEDPIPATGIEAAAPEAPEAAAGVQPPEPVEIAEIPLPPADMAGEVEELTVSPGPAPVATLPGPAAAAAVTAEPAQPVSVLPAESMLSVHRLPSLQPSSEAPAADLPTATILPAPVAPGGGEAERIARSEDRTVQTEDRASVAPVTAESPAIAPVSRPDMSVGTVAADLVAGTAERIRDTEIIRLEAVDPAALDRLDATLPPQPVPADVVAGPLPDALTDAPAQDPPDESPPAGASNGDPGVEAPADAAEGTAPATELAAAGGSGTDAAEIEEVPTDTATDTATGPARDAAGRLVITAETVDFADLRGDAEPDPATAVVEAETEPDAAATPEPLGQAEADPPGGVTRPVITAETVDPATLLGDAAETPTEAEIAEAEIAEAEIAEAEIAEDAITDAEIGEAEIAEAEIAAGTEAEEVAPAEEALPTSELAMLPPPDTLPAAAEAEVEAEIAVEPEGPLPMVAALSTIEPPRPAWQRFAADATPVVGDGPTISVIVTGLGQSRSRTEIAMNTLPRAVGLAFDPYAAEIEALVAAARDRGHEILMTVPMEAATAAIDPGPMALSTALPPEENADRLSWVLDRARGYVGVLTPPEALFAADPEAMDPIIRILRAQGLMVVAGAPGAIAGALPADLPVAEAGGAVAIPEGPQGFATMFEQAERTARETGGAVLLVSPYPATLRSLADWLETLPEKGLTLIPVTASVGDPQSAALP